MQIKSNIDFKNIKRMREIAEIYEIIEGASEGVGLGIKFLRHVERTRLLLHVIDVSGSEGRNPVEDYEKINRELKKFSEKLANKKQIVVANKIDILQDEENINELEKICKENEEKAKDDDEIIESAVEETTKTIEEIISEFGGEIKKQVKSDMYYATKDGKDYTVYFL